MGKSNRSLYVYWRKKAWVFLKKRKERLRRQCWYCQLCYAVRYPLEAYGILNSISHREPPNLKVRSSHCNTFFLYTNPKKNLSRSGGVSSFCKGLEAPSRASKRRVVNSKTSANRSDLGQM